MAEKKKHSSRRSIFKYLLLIPQYLGLFRYVLHKVKLETYFTVKNIIILLMLALMLACLLTATWVSLLGILFFALLHSEWSFPAAAFLIMLINLIFLLMIGLFIKKVKDKLIDNHALRHMTRRD